MHVFFSMDTKDMNDIFNNYIACSASHMHPELHFQNVYGEPWVKSYIRVLVCLTSLYGIVIPALVAGLNPGSPLLCIQYESMGAVGPECSTLLLDMLPLEDNWVARLETDDSHKLPWSWYCYSAMVIKLVMPNCDVVWCNQKFQKKNVNFGISWKINIFTT